MTPINMNGLFHQHEFSSQQISSVDSAWQVSPVVSSFWLLYNLQHLWIVSAALRICRMRWTLSRWCRHEFTKISSLSSSLWRALIWPWNPQMSRSNENWPMSQWSWALSSAFAPSGTRIKMSWFQASFNLLQIVVWKIKFLSSYTEDLLNDNHNVSKTETSCSSSSKLTCIHFHG